MIRIQTYKVIPLLLFIIVIAALLFLPYFSQVELPDVQMAAFGSETVRAQVDEIIEDGQIDLGGTLQRYQIARVEILEGDYAGILMEIDYGKRQVLSGNLYLQPGDEILVTLGKRADNVLTAYFVDFVRTRVILWLFLAFVVAILLISRWEGLRSLLGMLFSLFIIIAYIIPHILVGEDPVRVSIIGSVILLGVTLYLTYGWNLKTHAAVLGMVSALLITGTLAWFFVVFTRLTGAGDENALFLMQSLNSNINLRGLLLGGMIIGALGVLDDLVITQASAAFELYGANPGLGFRGLYHAAMRIGQDHVAATVNTLVLAYAGASLPMLLLFSLGRGDYASLVNYSFVAEEVVRTLVGSLGLVAAVPLTTAIAAGFALYREKLGAWEQVLGPEGSGEGHHH
ncbi:MAG: YibE/F family protein [Anaerolineales bacterium]